MFEKVYWNPVSKSDKFGWDLAAENLKQGQTCLVHEPDMSGKGYWNLAPNQDMFGTEARHVQTMPLKSSQKLGYVRFFYELWFGDRFQ
jgi:hypothetical protein